MKKQSIRFLALLLAMLMVLSGCTAAPADGTTQKADPVIGQESNQTEVIPEETTISEEEKEELWVVYGTDVWTGFPQTKYWAFIVEQYSLTHPDVEVRLEAVPKDEMELQRLRTQIMAGKGPELYLMCRNDTLFADPYQSMRNGLFADLSEYYDTDTSLNKE